MLKDEQLRLLSLRSGWRWLAVVLIVVVLLNWLDFEFGYAHLTMSTSRILCKLRSSAWGTLLCLQ